jgi:hypothetical protein
MRYPEGHPLHPKYARLKRLISRRRLRCFIWYCRSPHPRHWWRYCAAFTLASYPYRWRCRIGLLDVLWEKA